MSNFWKNWFYSEILLLCLTMEHIASFGIHIAAGVFLIVLTAFVGRAMQVRSARRIWRLKDPKQLFVCISTSAGTDTGQYTRLASGLGQIRGLAILIPSLSQAYREIDAQRILMSEDEVADRAEQDLIILGGPKTNRLAKDVLSLAKDILPATLEEYRILWKGKGEPKIYTPKFENNEIVKDYGLVVRTRNPYNPGRTVVLLCGTHTYGTVAAARFFVTELIKLRYLFLNDFAAIVKASVTDRHVSKPTLLHLDRIHRRYE